LLAHVRRPARNRLVVVTRRLKVDFPAKESGAHAAIKTIEIPEGTQVAFVIDHCGEVGDVHRDVSTEPNLLGDLAAFRLLLLNPFDLSAAEDDIKLSACQRSAHSL